ncbi:putative inorganic phosphate cotransporter isoform X2 [Anthonomus grandis grandis]|nr:putative inorganic phosphate cotransporter isoform X2 [Anthonomus grandis grandis]
MVPLVSSPWGSNGVIAMRVIQGLAQGSIFPTTQTLLGRWAPVEERSTFGGIIYSGISTGSVIAFVTSGYICSSTLGWPFTFYLWGAVGLLWCVLYFFLGFNCPAAHPRIRPGERAFIEQSLHQTETDLHPKLPLKSILTCTHFWAIVSANIGNAWIYTILMTEVSSYFAKVMKFNINSNGLVSAIPYTAAAISGFIFAPIADCLIEKHLLSRVNTRRAMQCIGSYGMSICLILVGYVAYTQLAAVTLLTTANIFYAATLLGYPLGPVDLSPKFCGIMYGISNTISFGIAAFCPVLVHFVVKNKENAKEWQMAFLITGVLFIICATLYAIFISAERQPWDSVPEQANI